MSKLVKRTSISGLILGEAEHAFVSGIKHRNLRDHFAGKFGGYHSCFYYVAGKFDITISHMISATNQLGQDAVDCSGMTDKEILAWGLTKSVHGQEG